MMSSSGEYIKLVMLGEGRVGQTSLTVRFCQDQFDPSQESTINASYLEKTVTTASNDTVNVAIWDTAGQEKFHALTPLYYRDALGAIIVYDITFKQSFDRVQKWIEELKQYGGKDMVIAITGNKCDMETQRQIPKDQADQYCAGFNIKHFQTSAQAKTGVEEIFGYVVKEIVDQKQKKKNQKGGLMIGDKSNGSSSSVATSSYIPPPDKTVDEPVAPPQNSQKPANNEQIKLGETKDNKGDQKQQQDDGCC